MTFQDGCHTRLSLVCLFFVQFSRCVPLNFVKFRFQYLMFQILKSTFNFPKYWWAKVDSNHRPHDYQSCALTSWAIGPYLVEISGIEPLTSCLQSRRSPSWAKPPYPFVCPLGFSRPQKLNNDNLFPESVTKISLRLTGFMWMLLHMSP